MVFPQAEENESGWQRLQNIYLNLFIIVYIICFSFEFPFALLYSC